MNAIARTVAWFLLIGGSWALAAAAVTLDLLYLLVAACCFVWAIAIAAAAIRSDR